MVKLVLMHVIDWHEAQEEDRVLVACIKWLRTHKDTPKEKQDAQLKKCLGDLVDIEEGHALFCMCHSLTLSKELLYPSMTPKGELEGVLAFLVPTSQCTTALNGVHCGAGHQGQQRMFALVQQCF